MRVVDKEGMVRERRGRNRKEKRRNWEINLEGGDGNEGGIGKYKQKREEEGNRKVG